MIDGKFADFCSNGTSSYGDLDTALVTGPITSVQFAFDNGRVHLTVNGVDITMPMQGTSDFIFILEVK